MKHFSLRDKGFVLDHILDQGDSVICQSLAFVESMTSARAARKGVKPTISSRYSAQQVIDGVRKKFPQECASHPKDKFGNVAFPIDLAYQFGIEEGLYLDKDYPLNFENKKIKRTIPKNIKELKKERALLSFAKLTPLTDDEKPRTPTVEEIWSFLQDGPLTGIISYSKTFRSWRGWDIYTGPSKEDLEEHKSNAFRAYHALVITGCGTDIDANGSKVDYVEVKNSEGLRWGKDGFGRVALDCISDFMVPFAVVSTDEDEKSEHEEATTSKQSKSKKQKRCGR